MLYCAVLCCTVLYGTVRYGTVLPCSVPILYCRNHGRILATRPRPVLYAAHVFRLAFLRTAFVTALYPVVALCHVYHHVDLLTFCVAFVCFRFRFLLFSYRYNAVFFSLRFLGGDERGGFCPRPDGIGHAELLRQQPQLPDHCVQGAAVARTGEGYGSSLGSFFSGRSLTSLYQVLCIRICSQLKRSFSARSHQRLTRTLREMVFLHPF